MDDKKQKKIGKVYLVGAGPGDPGLLTLKAARVLSEADAVVFDHLVDERILSHARHGTRRIYAGKEGGRHTLGQDEINRLIVETARAGDTVVRLKGGDPFIFGRGGEEALELVRAGIPFEVVPGVSSASAVPAYAGIPVTHRGISSMVVFVTGHEDPTKDAGSIDWEYLARFEGTIVILMGVKRIGNNAQALISGGKSPLTPCAVISWGTTPAQKGVSATLGEIAREVERNNIGAPAVMVVGEVASLRDRLAWFEKLPLFGRRIVVTRSEHQKDGLSRMLRDLGARPVELPTIKIVPPEDQEPITMAIRSLSAYDLIVFTSPNGVAAFFGHLTADRRDGRALGGLRVAAMGPGTSESLEDHGIVPDIVPDRYIAEALAQKIIDSGIGGKNILLFRAEGARDVLPRLLGGAGGQVTDVTAYRSTTPEITDEAFVDAFLNADMVTFTSGSTAGNLRTIIDLKRSSGRINMGAITVPPGATIGPITTKAAREAGFEVACEASEHTMKGLVDALITHFLEKR
jgi:uroporphyrinogen III methyltransferase/synthase